MANASQYFTTEIITHAFLTSSWTKPSSLYIALFTAEPSASGGGTEVSTSGTAYARLACNPSSSNWTGPTSGNGVVSNTAALNFGTATANWGTVTSWAIFDASTGGNMYAFGNFASSEVVNSGNSFQISANQLVLTFS